MLKYILCAALVTGAAWAQQPQAENAAKQQPRLETLAERLDDAAGFISAELRSTKGKLADAVLGDENEGLFSRFEDAAGDLREATEDIDESKLKSTVGLEKSEADRTDRVLRDYNSVRVLARAVETDLARAEVKSWNPQKAAESQKRFEQDVKPILKEMSAILQPIATARGQSIIESDRARM
jgi:hypothetical protein